MDKSEKRLRFEKVAGKRVQRVIDTIDLIANCSNRNNYEYDEKDVDQMFGEISRHLRDAKNAYQKGLPAKEGKKGFSFD